MFGHRLRRWPNIKQTLGQLLVITGQRIPIGIQTWNQRQLQRHLFNNDIYSVLYLLFPPIVPIKYRTVHPNVHVCWSDADVCPIIHGPDTAFVVVVHTAVQA